MAVWRASIPGEAVEVGIGGVVEGLVAASISPDVSLYSLTKALLVWIVFLAFLLSLLLDLVLYLFVLMAILAICCLIRLALSSLSAVSSSSLPDSVDESGLGLLV